MKHFSGFVNIIGNPNVGKSTLMNLLVGESLSIITPKAQTTRRSIRGIVNGEDFQIVFTDTPGILKPNYLLQENMMKFVNTAMEDADVILFVTSINDHFTDEEFIQKLNSVKIPIILIINKIDLTTQEKLESLADNWRMRIKNLKQIIPVSALAKFNVETVIGTITKFLPESPAYFPPGELTDLSQRFFISEMIREKVFINYQKEIPYATEIIIESFKEEETIVRIRAVIYVERESQKGIILGHKGEAIKRVGIQSRKDMEKFLGKKVFLEMFVKVKEDWRNNKNVMREFGYDE
ncbi:MAG: GTPase Era [Bacteroidota bacterium]